MQDNLAEEEKKGEKTSIELGYVDFSLSSYLMAHDITLLRSC